MNPQTEALRACPWCGESNARVCKTTYLDRYAYAVACRTRDCHGAIFSLAYGQFPTEALAIAAWNHRTTPAADEVEHPSKLLSAEIAADPEIAWAWYCNIAMPIVDAAGISHKLASETAAHLMQHLFGYDITTHKHYEYGKSDAQKYAEFRIEMDRQEDEELARQALAPGDVR